MSLLAALAVAAVSDAGPAAAVAPTVSSFTPTSGGVGVTVTINGSALSGATVKFNGRPASVSSNNGTQIVTKVPTFATSGPISVSTSGGTVTTAQDFAVTPGVLPSPTVAPPGGEFFVYGTAFAPNEVVDITRAPSTALAIATTDEDGNFQVLAVMPNINSGDWTLLAVGRTSGVAASTTMKTRVDWLQPGYSARHRGYNPMEFQLTTGSAPKLDAGWDASQEGGYSYSFNGGAVEYGGVVFVVDGFQQYLRSFNAGTGAPGWKLNLPGITGGAAVSNGVVYVAFNDGNVKAFKTSNGALVWASCPTCATAPVSIGVTPTIANGIVYAIDANGTVWFLSVADGSVVTSKSGFGPNPSGPVAVNGANIYVTGSSAGAGFTARYGPDGGVSSGSAPPPYGGPVYDQGTAYTAHQTGVVKAFGAVAWQVNPDAANPLFLGPPAVAYSTVFTTTNNQKLYALNQFTGATKWSKTLAAAASGAPSVANNVVYVPENAMIELFDINGNPLGQIGNSGYFATQPLIANGQVIAGGGWSVNEWSLTGDKL